RGWHQRQRAPGTFAAAGALMAASIMSKGPVPVFALLLPYLVAYLIAFGGSRIRKHWSGALLAGLVALVLGTAWSVWVYWKAPELLEAVALKESNSWVERHQRPFYFYLHFPIFTGIWVLFMSAALIPPYARKRFGGKRDFRFLMTWVLLALVLISAVPTKKERYLLPLFVPMALCISALLRYLIKAYRKHQEDRWDRLLVGLHGWILGLGLILAPAGFYHFLFAPGTIGLTLMIVFSAVAVLTGIALLVFLRQRAIQRMVFASVFTVAFVTVLLLPYLPRLYYQYPEFRDVGDVQHISEVMAHPFYSPTEFNMKLVWAVGKPVVPLDLTRSDWPQRLPMTFFSAEPPEDLFSQEVRD
ncbi:MAG: hypothetical protein AAGB22_15255, partial [Bacteroidota bacterium]